MSKLIIVESPTKAKTIAKFLSKDYQLESSFGHIRDLPKSTLGIDVEHNFEPKYLIPVKSRKVVNHLKSLAKKSDGVILATDEDREGEAIAWHLVQALGLKESDVERIVFHEITKDAIQEALKNPRHLDMDQVDAQQARRVLDRIVGYKLSPFLWKKVARRLSAGRVQSVAVRLIVDRENEIRAFKPQEYWNIIALLLKDKNEIETHLLLKDKFDVKTKAQADKITADLEKAEYQVAEVKRKEVKRNPLPPFTTSTLQQASSNRLHFSSKKTMFLAQRLYEKGRITYMRTDSVNLSRQALADTKNWLAKNLGEQYAEQAPRVFKTKSKTAQEAHEAIRPTDVAVVPETFSGEADEKKLYQLIWQRFTASQMPQAIFDSTTVDVKAGEYILRASGNIMKFDGYLKIWPQKFEQKELPEIKEGDVLELKEVKPSQHFTEPPPRYTEASLVKTLEEHSIGRPSTYAPIISVIQDRYYVEKEGGRFSPTATGELVSKILVEHFSKIVDINFTAQMEDDLDKVAAGKKEWQELVKIFYEPFMENLEKKYEQVKQMPKPEPEKTDEVCDKCNKPMVVRHGRFGKFIACSGFPECKNIKNSLKSTGLKCEKCNKGDVVEKFARKRHRRFWGCSRYPDCDYATWENPVPADAKEETKKDAA